MNIVKITVSILLSFIFFINSAFSKEIDCKKCHAKIFKTTLKNRFKHPDFMMKECKGCHLRRESFSQDTLDKVKNVSSSFVLDDLIKIGSQRAKWKNLSLPIYSQEHFVVLRNLTPDSVYKFRVKVIDRKGMTNRSSEVAIVPSAITDFFVDDETKPDLTAIEVERVDLSVFAVADIKWESNRFADSKVEYGVSQEYGNFVSSGHYSKTHKMVLKGLKSNNSYHYRVISKDPFGNRTVSGDLTFSTSESFNKISTIEPSPDADEEKPEIMVVNFLRFKKKNDKKSVREKDIAIRFTTNRDVKASIEFIKTEKAEESVSDEDKHGVNGLQTKRTTSIDQCIACHSRDSHTVGMRNRRRSSEIIMHEELPTIENGVMTCVTCHLPHSGEYMYLIRAKVKRELCVLCHINRI